MAGTYLEPDVWNEVQYTGPTQPVEDAIASISQHIIRIWYLTPADEWLMYDPEDPTGSDLETMEQNEIYQIKVSQRVWWDLGEAGAQKTEFPWLLIGGIGVALGAIFLIKKK